MSSLPHPAALPRLAVLLAGGRSRRMGQDKAGLPFRGRPLWQQQADTLQQAGARSWILSCRPEQELDSAALAWSQERAFPLQIVHDPADCSQGVLGALARCLRHAGQGLLFLTVDMPHLNADLLQPLWPSDETAQGGFWQGPRGPEPFPAFYPFSLLPALEKALQQERAPALTHWLVQAETDGHSRRHVLRAEDHWRLANWNTPEERQASL